ncbi:glycosyltransferase [uncultured Fibrobacter sp.]|uniref:glycosyltransferase family 4 protein n=1 Tax=uncultured Fibrobacter sp. TaxID=261512 RepID=UPI0026025951|nr:glycosyltransferase [uncultured Fibrobacter sp.]
MRILFFSNIPIRKTFKGSYNGGGWISSLIDTLVQSTEHEIAVGYFSESDEKITDSQLTIYKMKEGNILKRRLKKWLSLFPFSSLIEKKSWLFYEKKLLSVIADYKPDIIHIFGTEHQFGLISNKTNVPTIIHIQGVLNPYFNAFLPPFFSWYNNFFRPIHFVQKYIERKTWQMNCFREKEIFSRNQNYIGRTDWDKRVAFILNPKSIYFYGSEILRNDFYREWQRKNPKELIIISTISSPLYKGFDTILKTAFLLKSFKKDFIWKVFGNINPTYIEGKIGIKHSEVDVKLEGVANTETLIESIIESSVYVHPSYIDNSPNSVCEAQMLGVPVIATNVGGLASIIDDCNTGFLVPSNDPYQMAYMIDFLYKNKKLNEQIGYSARIQALKRHDRNRIINDLLDVYRIISKK